MKATKTKPAERFEIALLNHTAALVKQVYGGRTPGAFVHSYGCQQNVSDGEKIKGMLTQMGFELQESADGADIVIFNTCAVREHAEVKLFGNVGALKVHKRRNPGMIIGLCGCMMQQEHVQDKIRQSYPYVDLVFGTHALHHLPQNLGKLLTANQSVPVRVFDTEANDKNEVVEGLPIRRDGDFKAWVPIMYGCDNFCTYCVVPLVRGREVSRRPAEILDEIRGLVESGYREITLLGQNVNSYGKGLDEPCDFADLLQAICDIPGDFWVRFMTSHPKDITPKVLDTMARNREICSHLHLPVQCGSDRVLKAMNRKYDREKYMHTVDYARKVMPDITFTSDIIVGFPGETRQEFEQTLDLVREVSYNNLFMFIFSPRTGTPAAKMDDPVDYKEKVMWFQDLQAVQRQVAQANFSSAVGTKTRVLAEELGKKEGWLNGRDEHFRVVTFQGDTSLIGQFVDVKIKESANWALEAEIIK